MGRVEGALKLSKKKGKFIKKVIFIAFWKKIFLLLFRKNCLEKVFFRVISWVLI